MMGCPNLSRLTDRTFPDLGMSGNSPETPERRSLNYFPKCENCLNSNRFPMVIFPGDNLLKYWELHYMSTVTEAVYEKVSIKNFMEGLSRKSN